ncbi:MAG TPA: HAMP domain-containing sensor histidine kinase, partial [Spirochaetia bacterium]|nr:HAMP domain-containing sensor histidine kinase [Spirochaetia bacterium]
NGPAPGLLSWVGYQEAGSETWNRLDGQGWSRIPAPTQGDRSAGSFARFQTDRTSPNLLLGFDSVKFARTYAEPVLKEQYPGATLEWLTDAPDRGPPQGPGGSGRTYAFNPLAALTGGGGGPMAVSVPLPPFPEFAFRNFRFPDGVLTPGGRGTQGQVKLTLASDGPATTIEQRLAWNWWGTTLLLLVLGAAFALVLRQTGRVADLRRREREFVASVSHELRTPLTVIRSAADNFSQGIVPPERQAKYGQLILDQALRLGRMVEHMLSFAQAEVGPSAPVWAPLAFRTWVAEIQPALENLAHDREVRLVWDVAGVPAGGRTDPDALRSILENLVVNAVNHAYPAPPGTGTRIVRVTLRFLVPNRLQLTVDDDGRGISPKEAKNVFEPFYRDQVSRNTQEKGSGLGLFLARRQARRLGGDLKLESPWRRTDGVRRPGCRFVLLIPFEAEGEEAHDGR